MIWNEFVWGAMYINVWMIVSEWKTVQFLASSHSCNKRQQNGKGTDHKIVFLEDHKSKNICDSEKCSWTDHKYLLNYRRGDHDNY